MPSIDIFNDDAFGVVSLTASINEQEAVPGRIGQLGLYQEEGISTTSAFIEIEGEKLTLVPASERGTTGDPTTKNPRRAIPVNAIHLSTPAMIKADEIQNVRAFGSETDVQLVTSVVNGRLAKMRRRLDATLEYQRIGGLFGKILDADGSTVLVDLLAQMGVEQSKFAMKLTDASTDVVVAAVQAKRISEKKLGAAATSGFRALCSPGFFDKFVGHASVKDAWNFFNAQNKSDDLRAGFQYGKVTWEEYNAEVNGIAYIPDGKALLVPEGVADMFITNFAPADYVETVGTIGLPMYAKQELAPMGKGVNLEAQSNPISYCTRPTAVVVLSA